MSSSSSDIILSKSQANMLSVPSTSSTTNGGQDYDVLSDVVMDDSRNPSAAPSRQVCF